MEYKPNWSDPRVQKKLTEVLDWTRFSLNELAPTAIHHDKLAQVFGSRSNKLGNKLRNELLVREGSYTAGVSSFGYKLNRGGFKKLKALIATQDVDDVMVYTSPALVVKGHEHELLNLEFEYTESSDRFWHPFQNIKRDAKTEFWNPYLPFDYDIEACAPTLLFQLAQKLELPEILMAEVKDYLAHKAEWRARLANLTGLDSSDAKRLLNSLFNGARLTPHPTCAAYRLVGFDRERLDAVKNDHQFKMLRNSIKNIWNRIGFTTGENLSSGKMKWSVYFKFERRILSVIKATLREQGIKFFTEHDGFRTNKQIDKPKILEAIQKQTGFKLKMTGPTS